MTTSAIAYDSDDHGDAPSSSSDDEGDQHQPRAVLAPTRAGSRSNIVRSLRSSMRVRDAHIDLRQETGLVESAGPKPMFPTSYITFFQGVVENPAERSHGKPKQKQSSADRLAKLKLSQGKKSKSRGPRAKVSKSRKGKPGKGKRS